jgi:hypothetical protein
MNYNSRNKFCYKCDSDIYENEYQYSTNEFGIALCRNCQNWNRAKLSGKTTQEAINLFLVLKRRGVPAELEKFDGYKTIDIAIPEAKLNIEVDGQHHNYNPNQALSDLQRTMHSFRKGFYTVRIPNSLIRDNLYEAAEILLDILIEGRDRNLYDI